MRLHPSLAVLSALSVLALGACGNERSAAPPAPPASPVSGASLKPGQPAPAFDVTGSDGTRLASSELLGRPVVLYFYPKDETPSCTAEACSFRDGWDALQKKGVVMIGVSTDDAASHRAFADHHNLPFYLVSDPGGALAASYGVGVIHSRNGDVIERQTIVIGADGNVKKIHRAVDVRVHASEVQADVAS